MLLIFTIWLIIIQFQVYEYPQKEEIDKRLNYLEKVINEPLESGSEVILLRHESHEFMLFSYSFATYAFTNLAVKDSTYKKRVVPIIKESISKALDPKISHYYGIDSNFNKFDTLPHYSVLYMGHLNLMLGCYRMLSDDSTYNILNDKISSSLFKRYKNKDFLNLESYPSAIWIPDNTVALASLRLHGHNTGSGYDSLCKEWVRYAKTHYLHNESRVLYSTVDPSTGKPEEDPRGSMLGWSIMFIYQFDSEFSIELYNNYKKHFSNEWLIFKLFKERYKNNSTSMGDIDSGPIFLGYSIPANEFALGGAILTGDYKTARKLERLINFGTTQKEINRGLKYKVRFVDMNISPMAETLVLNSLTITKWIKD